MSEPLSRRDALKQIAAAGAGVVATGGIVRGQGAPIRIAGIPVEIAVASISVHTVRITAAAIVGAGGVPEDGALVKEAEAKPIASGRVANVFKPIKAGNLVVRYTAEPPTIHVDTAKGQPVQKLTLSADQPGVSFLLPKGPLLGLGEGGPQFDRKGAVDRIRNGQGGYQLRTHGGRVPFSGWSARTAGACSFISRSGRSISPARKGS